MTSAYISNQLRDRVAEQARYRCGYCLSSEQIGVSPWRGRSSVPTGPGTLPNAITHPN